MRLLALPIDALFNVEYGNTSLTKKYIRAHPGSKPVFGATVDPDKAIGLIATADHAQDGLSFVRIGYAGHVALRKAPFSVTCNVMVLAPKPDVRECLHLPYFVPVISAALKSIAVGRPGKGGRHDYMQVSRAAARAAKVLVPVSEDGSPDPEEQRVLTGNYARIAAAKSELAEMERSLGRLRLALPLDGVATIEMAVAETFDLKAGDGRYTRMYVRAHPGEYPRYTAETLGAEPEKIDTWDHDTEAIHYTIQGKNAGTVFHRPRHRFSMTADAGILVRKMDCIDYRYAYHALAAVFAQQGFRWASNTASQAKVLGLKLPFPASGRGAPDPKMQEAIAARLDVKLKAKEEIRASIRRLLEKDVVIVSERGVSGGDASGSSPSA